MTIRLPSAARRGITPGDAFSSLVKGGVAAQRRSTRREPSFTWIAASVSTPSPASTIAPTKGTLKSSCSSAPTGRPRAPPRKMAGDTGSPTPRLERTASQVRSGWGMNSSVTRPSGAGTVCSALARGGSPDADGLLQAPVVESTSKSARQRVTRIHDPEVLGRLPHWGPESTSIRAAHIGSSDGVLHRATMSECLCRSDLPLTIRRRMLGEVISDRYRVTQLLATGGTSTVYLAQHIHMLKQVAIKVLDAKAEKLPELVARFQREAIAGAHVQHANIASATDFGQLADGSYFLVLEYVAGPAVERADSRRGQCSPIARWPSPGRSLRASVRHTKSV